MPTIPKKCAEDLALRFVDWMFEHDLSRRAWTVDDVWWLAEEDFGPAHDLALPPRRVFLGALQRCHGVIVAYDRRVGRAVDGRRKKTTFYRFDRFLELTSMAA